MDGMTLRAETISARHDVPMTVDEMAAHPMVRVASSGSWLDSAR